MGDLIQAELQIRTLLNILILFKSQVNLKKKLGCYLFKKDTKPSFLLENKNKIIKLVGIKN